MSEKDESYYIDQIDAYLSGTLSQIDKQAYDDAINQNPSLRDKIESHIIARSAIRGAGEQDLKSKFLKELTTKKHISTNRKRSPLPYLLFLLAIAILFLIALQIYNRSVSESAVNYDPIAVSEVEDPSYTLLRSQDETSITSTWESAIQSFVNKDYNTCLSLLDSLNENAQFISDHNGKYTLMKGVSNLKIEEYKNAEKILLTIDEENPYYDQAKWYLALTSYYNNDITIAKLRLNTISQDLQHYKKSEASHYLKSME